MAMKQVLEPPPVATYPPPAINEWFRSKRLHVIGKKIFDHEMCSDVEPHCTLLHEVYGINHL